MTSGFSEQLPTPGTSENSRSETSSDYHDHLATDEKHSPLRRSLRSTRLQTRNADRSDVQDTGASQHLTPHNKDARNDFRSPWPRSSFGEHANELASRWNSITDSPQDVGNDINYHVPGAPDDSVSKISQDLQQQVSTSLPPEMLKQLMDELAAEYDAKDKARRDMEKETEDGSDEQDGQVAEQVRNQLEAQVQQGNMEDFENGEENGEDEVVEEEEEEEDEEEQRSPRRSTRLTSSQKDEAVRSVLGRPSKDTRKKPVEEEDNRRASLRHRTSRSALGKRSRDADADEEEDNEEDKRVGLRPRKRPTLEARESPKEPPTLRRKRLTLGVKEAAKEPATSPKKTSLGKTQEASDSDWTTEDEDEESDSESSEEELPPIPKDKQKKWLPHGLYSGQEYTTEMRAYQSKDSLKRKHGARAQRRHLPMPMFAGDRMLRYGRDFVLPYDIFSPLPPGQPKPDEWKKANKSKFFF